MELKRTTDPSIITTLNEPVHRLHHQLYPDMFKPYDAREMYDYFNQVVDKDNHHFIICEEHKNAIGYIWFEEIMRPENAFRNSMHYIYINQVSVNEEQRGKGVGKLLFNAVLELAEKKSIRRIGLDYWAKNESAKIIYKNMGFKIEKEIAYFERD